MRTSHVEATSMIPDCDTFAHRDLRGKRIPDDILEQKSFRGSNLTGVQLPERFTFNGLQRIEEISRNARILMYVLTTGCVYVMTTTYNIADTQLVTGDGLVQLPFFSVSIPTSSYIYLSTCLIFALYVHFQLTLQPLWEALGKQPAVYPDGIQLDEKVYPWLANVFIAFYSPYRSPRFSWFVRLRLLTAWVMIWGLGPLALISQWIIVIKKQDLYYMYFFSGATLLVILFAMSAFNLAKRELEYHQPNRSNMKIAYLFVVAGFLLLVSFALVILYGSKLNINYLYPVANKADISKKPKDWAKMEEIKWLSMVKGAKLSKKRLRFLQASQSFLYTADLSAANLEGAQLDGADLRRANLKKARLSGANLKAADIAGAKFDGAIINNVRFNPNNMPSSFKAVNLTNSDITQLQWHFEPKENEPFLDMSSCNFSGAKGIEISFQNIDLREAKFPNVDFSDMKISLSEMAHVQIEKATIQAKITHSKLMKAKITYSNMVGSSLVDCYLNNADLSYSNFTGVSFTRCRLTGTKLLCTNLSDADLSNVIGLDFEQLKQAIINAGTMLPPAFNNRMEELITNRQP